MTERETPPRLSPEDEAAYPAAANVFKIMGDFSRLKAVLLMRERPMSVGELREAVGMSQGVACHHLATLRVAGLVEARREGGRVYYGLTARGEDVARMAGGLAS